jgi:hypothetical protein
VLLITIVSADPVGPCTAIVWFLLLRRYNNNRQYKYDLKPASYTIDSATTSTPLAATFTTFTSTPMIKIGFSTPCMQSKHVTMYQY